ncbi:MULTISPECIES: hypothetical protein [Novosphingopyxis]|uniref:hypothetical protein n=1 Tax=Novosphingopyxis TaxID=2709686 RepID=UPI0016516782|nr:MULTISPECIES: hypothetical protein [Novosphingopyxis]MBH9536403.1 hypothetical protein [Novosphingopyxis sp. YJ-S2-01]|tara:strand:+ start:709 stop:888 length:180 start_codon:yes stop_codon:yes gene_type:complete
MSSLKSVLIVSAGKANKPISAALPRDETFLKPIGFGTQQQSSDDAGNWQTHENSAEGKI